MKLIPKIAATLSLFAMATAANAVVIDYTGGVGAGPSITHYEENGFQMDIIGGVAFVGDYYGAGNDVVHAHWAGGCCGTVTEIVYSKIGGGTFDLNYFILTSNTAIGGGAATGAEKAYITHDGLLDPILLPPENWGFPATQIFLPSSYDAISNFRFHVESTVSCFGMDEFFIDEPAPPRLPDTGSALALLGLGVTALAAFKRSRK